MDLIEIKPCRKCNTNQWFHMLDCLAWACHECGQVLVGNPDFPDNMEYGASIQELLEDVYGDKDD